MDRTEQVRVESNEAGTTVVGVGALDLYNEDFGVAVKDAALTAENLVVDLQSVTYIDTAILANIATAAKRMLARGKRLKVLFANGSHPLRTLKMAGVAQMTDFVVEGV